MTQRNLYLLSILYLIEATYLGTWEHRGNVEKYFKHRYQDFNHKIGSLTEYYKFNTENAKNVLNDLQQMKPKVLSQNEMDILEDQPSLLRAPCKG